MGKGLLRDVLISILIILLSACQPRQQSGVVHFLAPTPMSVQSITSPEKPAITSTNTSMSPAAVPTSVQFFLPADDPAGCRRPPDDYTIVSVNGHTLNRRTESMLQYAQELYKGVIPLDESAVTQGSYTDAVAESFGTHDGGGAVDLSVFYPGTYQPAYGDIGKILRSLRTAGFAAWLRDLDELYPGSPIHIHAIAIGDRQLSPAAVGQVISDTGYFWGQNGLPANPASDRFGGPVICQWMVNDGLVPIEALTERSASDQVNFDKAIITAAESYQTDSSAETMQLVNTIQPVEVRGLKPGNLAGPLAAAALIQTGLVTKSTPLDFAYTYYWLPGGEKSQYFWDLLRDAGFDRSAMRVGYNDLLPRFHPGDVLYLYAGMEAGDTILFISEVSADGNAYSVMLKGTPDTGYLIKKQPLDNINPLSESAFLSQWLNENQEVQFELVRRLELFQPTGTIILHRVEPGDTIDMIAGYYFTAPEEIAKINTFDLDSPLAVNQMIKVPIKRLP